MSDADSPGPPPVWRQITPKQLGALVVIVFLGLGYLAQIILTGSADTVQFRGLAVLAAGLYGIGRVLEQLNQILDLLND